jgi:hypothetical protein
MTYYKLLIALLLALISVASGYLTSTLYDGDMRVYHETNDQIWELSWHRDSGQWESRNVLTDAGGDAAAYNSALTSTLYDGDMRVYYQAKNNHIWELSWHRDSGQWESRNVLTDAGGDAAVKFSELTSTLYDGDMRVYYQAINGHIWELSWHRDSGQWESRDVLADAKGDAAVKSSALTSTLYDGDMRVYYQAINGHIWELSWHRDSGQWESRDVLADAKGDAAVKFSELTSTLYDGDMRVYYQAINGHIWELSWHRDSGQWESRDVLADAGEDATHIIKGSYLTSTLYDGDLRVYHYNNAHIMELSWHRDSGQWRSRDVKAL